MEGALGEIFTPALDLSVGGRHFENGDFRKRWRHDNHVISLAECSSNTKPKRPVIAPFIKFFQLSVDGKHLTQLQPETFALKFLRRAYCGWRSILSSRQKQLASVVRGAYNAFIWINHYPVDIVVCFVNIYQMDSMFQFLNYWGRMMKLITFTFIVNLSISIKVCLSHHFVQLFICEFLAKVHHNLS